MLEGIVADVLVRVLGSYVDGLNRESIRVGVWRGDLELNNLRLRQDALAILFETLGLDLPVTVTAGYIGLLRLEVPWKSLSSAPVRIFMRDVNVVASPVSDGDQSALESRERRLKAARLATDEAVRDAKFSVRSELNNRPDSSGEASNFASGVDSQSATGGNRVTRWGWRFTSRVVTRIIDNIQIDVENVIVQYEDASSVRDSPYTCSLALDSLRACSTDRNWNDVFIESPDSPIVHKVLHARGLVLNWEPGNSNNDLRDWILNSDESRNPGHWSGFVHTAKRHAIRPMDGELRIALTKSSAVASALAGSDPSLRELRNIPRVQMDLHFPDVHIALDDFQYHTLLSTIMYLSDIDRKVRPKTARGRWFWALDRLLPRFKERREAVERFNAKGMRTRREARERYCKARNAVVQARRSGLAEPTLQAGIVEELELQLCIDDLMHFRDLADRDLYANLDTEVSSTSSYRFWSLFSRSQSTTPQEGMLKRSTSRESVISEPVKDSNEADAGVDPTLLAQRSVDQSPVVARDKAQMSSSRSEGDLDHTLQETNVPAENADVPNFRMGFLLGRGAIELRKGGAVGQPIPISSLEFRELRLGIETNAGASFLLEALLGTFEVVDLQKDMKVMYPRVPWAGEVIASENNKDVDEQESAESVEHPNTSMSQIAEEWLDENQLRENTSSAAQVSSDFDGVSPVLRSYPHDISDAICEIRGEYGIGSTPVPTTSPRFSPYRSSMESESSGSLSGMSDCGLSGVSTFNREDISMAMHSPLKYIAALRLNQEEATEGDWASGATRMAMDLAIGGMEVLIDGPKSAFVYSVSFWHPREKMPSIMQFLTRAAAPRLASLRMDIQKAILERSVPMRMDLLIRGPRFVIPGPPEQDVSLVLDMGTFAMETSTGPPEIVPREFLGNGTSTDSEMQNIVDNSEPLSVRYTDYKMGFTDLGLYIVSEAGRHAAECIVRPFSLHLFLEVLHNSSFIEAITLSYGTVNIAKVKLQGKLTSLRTSVSHHAFRQILDTIKTWGHRARMPLKKSGIEPNRAAHSLSVSAEMEEVRQSHNSANERRNNALQNAKVKSPLISFEMILELDDLQLELRDSSARRIVTISSTGTFLQMKRKVDMLDFDYRVRSFTVTDGSRGATAPFRRLAYAGVDRVSKSMPSANEDSFHGVVPPVDSRSFITLSYRGDVVKHEQNLAVKILSLNVVCVRESYFALVDFFYLNNARSKATDKEDTDLSVDEKSASSSLEPEEGNAQYSDPFVALGMTTSGAAQALRHQAGRGMEISKKVIANRGRMSVNADLDGLNVTLVTAEGAIACFDVTNCKTHLLQHANGAVEASGDLGGFGVRDLTSAFDVYSETIRYNRRTSSSFGRSEGKTDGWQLKIPECGGGNIELHAYLRNIRIVYLHRFIIILKKYFDVLRQSLKPVLEMKGGLGEVFDAERGEDFPALPSAENRVNVNIITESIDIVMPRHSQSPYEALRFFVPRSSITNADIVAPGYQIGVQIQADDVDTYVLYQAPAEGEGRALTEGGTEPILKHITPNSPIENLTPFSRNICIVAKLDIWRRRRVPQVVLNTDGLPVLKDGEEEREYDPAKWLPAIRVRVSAPNGISARLCEAEYSILYFTFTENVIERPEIEFTDLVRGLKTPVLPVRRPVQPIMFSSNKMPPNYQIIFEVPRIDSVIMSGADPRDDGARLIRSQLRDLIGSFEYGVDYRMTIELNANMHSLVDIRPHVPSHGKTLITPTSTWDGSMDGTERAEGNEMTRSVTFTWDRPFGFRSNVMVVASDLRIIVEPELFRDLGCLTAPGFPFLKSSAPPPLLRFNGRLLIVTVSRPEVWIMANQFPGDGRSLVLRGDIIAKVQWAAVTGRQMVEVAANGIRVNLSNIGPSFRRLSTPRLSSSSTKAGLVIEKSDTETPMLYPCDISTRLDGSGYDPPESADGEAVKVPGSSLSINAESVLVRVDVNDTPLILAVGSRLVRMKPSSLSRRPVQAGRFDQWVDKDEDGDAKLSVHFELPHSRLMFTDETAGRYVPIMEARIRNAVLRSNVPWLTNAAFEFALDLFNEDKGWWEPGIEMFSLKIAASQGRSGSRAIHVHSERNIDVNITPNTVSGAARVSKALKSAIVDLRSRLRHEQRGVEMGVSKFDSSMPKHLDIQSATNAKRPSVAAFCIRNETGRSMVMWLPYDSKKQPLHGNGGEIEVDTPSEEILWTAVGATALSSADPNKNRQLSLSCILFLSGYVAKTLSAAQTGTWLVTLKPDTREITSPPSGEQVDVADVTLVWSVAMRDGVPCGCIRSVLRLVNRTRTVLEVNIGASRNAKSESVQRSFTNDIADGVSEEGMRVEHEPNGLVRAGESWSIPIHAIHRAIRIRPAIFHAPEADSSTDLEETESQVRSRVYYTYKWSDPLSKISALYGVGRDLCRNAREGDLSTPRLSEKSILSGPVLTCRADDWKNVFSMTLQPKIDRAIDWKDVESKEVPGWVDVHVCPPLIIENLLPRPMYFKLALPGTAKKISNDLVKAEGLIEPLREAHVHTVGSNLSNVALAVGTDNSPVHDTSSVEALRHLSTRHIGDFIPNLPTIKEVSIGIGRYTPFFLKLDHEKKVSTRHVRAFCEFWIRNRSDTDLFFRDRNTNRDVKDYSSPKVFLRGRAPGVRADKFICFSGRWLAFQRADATEDVWVNISTEVSEIDKPVRIRFEKLSLILEVRPAKGKLHRALIATIRNEVWLENRTGSVLQWCQPSALNAHGIALSSRVHDVKSGEVMSIHWDFGNRQKAICLRRVNDDGSSDWIWSRPVCVEGVEGEFVAKMYRPKRHEQYIARVIISKLRYGVLGVVVHREDRNTPPYRIVNNCPSRSIAFRQSGVHETHPWLVRPGKSSRYSWDDPQAPVKKRSLVVEVIEAKEVPGESAVNNARSKSLHNAGSLHSGSTEALVANANGRGKKGKEIRYPKFDLNIDLITNHVPFTHSSRFNPPLVVSVQVDGPTKVVTFSNGVIGEINQHPAHENSVTNQESMSDVDEYVSKRKDTRNLDVELYVNALGISFVDSTPTELAYFSVTGIHFRLDRFDGQQLITCEVQDLQLDNQLVRCSWPVVIWSPPPIELGSSSSGSSSRDGHVQRVVPKPFFQFTADGPYPSVSQGIASFRGIFVAIQQLQIAADEDFVLRVWLFVTSLIEAAGGLNIDQEESLTGNDGLEDHIPIVVDEEAEGSDSESVTSSGSHGNRSLKRLYVEHLELCPLKLTVSFTSSRTSKAAERIGGFRSLMRTLVAVLGNVENAEFRFNALELHHMFDSVSHFRSLITEFYVSQGSNQKMVLLASNSLIGNPSALFDSIAIGTRDFFVEPANAKGSADFIASIGRGSSSLLTNTVGGLVGSIGAIPRAVAQGLESAVGDRDYLAERDSIRGGRARMVSSPAQGLVTGALSFGHGIASAAAGLIRDPIQGAAEEGASGFIKGLGKGFIGGVLKPITGALDLIAEPAAGFRSMMVSDRKRECAEPVRPPRAFWGAHGDQMSSYDLRAALGHAILEAVTGTENTTEPERMVSWTHLVAVHHSANEDQVIAFLWALMRRSTRSSHFQTKYLLDAQGNPQRAEKMRAGLISMKRLIITSLDGHVLWEYPLADIVDTQVPLEAKDYLLVGVRPVGYSSRGAVAPHWKKIHCGSTSARDELNSAIRKAVLERRMTSETLYDGNAAVLGRPSRGGVTFEKERNIAAEDSHAISGKSVEMKDLSSAGGADDDSSGQCVEMKSLHRDASVDGKRGIFTNMKLPGRGVGEDHETRTDEGDRKEVPALCQEVEKAMSFAEGESESDAVRSMTILIANELEKKLVLHALLESGRWTLEPPRVIQPNTVVKVRADCGDDRVRDILGSLTLSMEGAVEGDDNDVCAIRFLNPTLAANAFAIKDASWAKGAFKGGEKGDHVATVLTLKKSEEVAGRRKMDSEMKNQKTTAEPLLFGRSQVTPFPPRLTVNPPNAPKEQKGDPEDPELIRKLSSLGFSEGVARQALMECEADVSAAYAKLVGGKSTNDRV